MTQGYILVQEEFCPKNHPCPVARSCPTGAISQETIYSAPKVDKEKCITCGLCTRSCRVYQCVGCS